MSTQPRDLLKAKLSLQRDASMPAAPPRLDALSEDDAEPDDLSDFPPSPLQDDSSSASSASSTSTIRPLFPPRHQPRKRAALEPVSWNQYFSASLFLESPETAATHHVYLTPSTASGPLFVAHHGAGSSGLSFALLASEIRKVLPTAGFLSLDARGHGQTSTTDDGDLSLSTLAADFVRVIGLTQASCKWPKTPDMILLGHSLGGAVVADVAKTGSLGISVLGYAVLDVVEGSAIDALQSMETYLSTRPSGFASLSQGIEWQWVLAISSCQGVTHGAPSTRSRTLRNPTSARVSVPALLQDMADDSPRPWKWRTDLGKTQPFWEGWFVGLSRKFLEARGGKLLILAGTDRLDKELMIGQMQGKYQLIVLPEVGHFLHEDAPEKTAAALVEFYKRNDRSALVLPPKVGDGYMSMGSMK